MAEYIEREELLKKAIKERRFVFQMEDLLNSEVIFKTVYKDLAEFINSIPAADVAPVRHGRWVLDEYARYFSCSACGTQFDDETDTYCNIMNGFAPNYCEDCGAKMDSTERS